VRVRSEGANDMDSAGGYVGTIVVLALLLAAGLVG
jgi:hypothetical protein